MALLVRELSWPLQQVAAKDLGEDPKRTAADVQAIREWLKKQPHIIAQPDDQTLVSFLRGCKFSLERTKEKLDMHYTMKTIVPEFFSARDLKAKMVRGILESAAYFPLPEPDDNGCRIMLVRPGQNNPDLYSMALVFKVNFMALDYLVREDDQMCVCGVINLIDLQDATLTQATQLTPSLIKKTMTCMQDGYSLREKGFNYINLPTIFNAVFNIFKTFTKGKVRDRMFVHANMESLYKKVPQRLLPTEYGGKAGTIKELNDAWIKRLDSYADWFLETDGVDESKRPGKPKTHQDLFGMEGSFRQLNVD